MNTDHNRYFLELPVLHSDNTPRCMEDALRRAQAELFIGLLQDWLDEKNLSAGVSLLKVTPFGQIQITCCTDVMREIREHDMLNITTIRRGIACTTEFAKRRETRHVS